MSLFQMNGGTTTLGGTFGSDNFGGGGGAEFNGGTLTASFLNYRHDWTLSMGGSTAGSATFSSGFGGTSHSAGNIDIDWISGSQMELTVAGQNFSSYETLWNSGKITPQVG